MVVGSSPTRPIKERSWIVESTPTKTRPKTPQELAANAYMRRLCMDYARKYLPHKLTELESLTDGAWGLIIFGVGVGIKSTEKPL